MRSGFDSSNFRNFSIFINILVRWNPSRTWNCLGKSIFCSFCFVPIILRYFQPGANFFTRWLFFGEGIFPNYRKFSKMVQKKKATGWKKLHPAGNISEWWVQTRKNKKWTYPDNSRFRYILAQFHLTTNLRPIYPLSHELQTTRSISLFLYFYCLHRLLPWLLIMAT